VGPEERELMLRQPQLQSAKADCEAAEVAKNVALAEKKAAEASKRTAEESKRSAEAAAQAAEAALASAQAALKKADLDLKRHTIKAPFNAILLSKSIDVGSQIAVGSELASLVGTDAFWIQVSVPVDQLHWIEIPGFNSENGAAVKVLHRSGWGNGMSRTGRVQQMMTDVEPEGRMARLLVVVEDPLDLKRPPDERQPLILNSYVSVAIRGRPLENVASIPRTSLRDGRRVWVAAADDKLDIRDVTIVWGGADYVFVSDGLHNGDRLITSDLGAPVQDMAVRTERRSPATKKPSAERKR
jgi:multidrug efflux pump subunit AcrA (membrane-fusion protein)